MHNGYYSVGDQDSGRYRISQDPKDAGKFKIPSLRNVSGTAPYFHDGEMESLEVVLEHYSLGGNNHPNKDMRIEGFILSSKQKEDLLNFLRIL